MTVSSTQTTISFDGTGAQTLFIVPFKFFADADLIVHLIVDSTQVPTLQVITTNYTVSGAGLESGGTVTFGVAPPVGTTVRIDRFVIPLQDLDLVENSKIDSEALEKDHDLLTMMIQQLLERTGGQGFQITTISTFTLQSNALNQWDGLGFIATNFADPASDTDLGTLQFLNAQIIASGNVPAPVLGDVGKFLEAISPGVFDWGVVPGSAVPTPADPADDNKMLVASGGVYLISDAAAVQAAIGVPPNARLISTTEGVTGGGDLSADRTHKLNTGGLAEITVVDAAADFLSILDDSDGIHKKVKPENLPIAGSMIKIEEIDAANQPSVIFKTGITSAFAVYEVWVTGMRPITDAVILELQVSEDGGTTFKSGAADYRFAGASVSDAGSGDNFADASSALIRLSNNARTISSDAGHSYSATIRMRQPADASLQTAFDAVGGYVDSSSRTNTFNVAGRYTTASVVDAIKLSLNIGNISSGKFVLYGIKD